MIVVPFGAGNVTDRLAREIGKTLSEQVSQHIAGETKHMRKVIERADIERL